MTESWTEPKFKKPNFQLQYLLQLTNPALLKEHGQVG